MTEDLDLAKKIYEVLKLIGEKECPECDGNKMIGIYIDDEECSRCNATGKVVGEWNKLVFHKAVKKAVLRLVEDSYHS